jgi:hypothetical protein
MIGRILCRLGFHRWSAYSISIDTEFGAFHRNCVSEGCEASQTINMNELDANQRSEAQRRASAWNSKVHMRTERAKIREWVDLKFGPIFVPASFISCLVLYMLLVFPRSSPEVDSWAYLVIVFVHFSAFMVWSYTRPMR